MERKLIWQKAACPHCGGATWMAHSKGCNGAAKSVADLEIWKASLPKPKPPKPHITVFHREQWSSLCHREEHVMEVGEMFYKIKRQPAVTTAKCQMQRREWMAGQTRDVVWVHTARYGRDLFRLVWWCIQAFWWSALVALVIAVIVPHLVAEDSDYTVCASHLMCNDVEFAHAVHVSTGHCAPECLVPCHEMNCGGSGTTCTHTDDGVCDEPFVCRAGTDYHDCHECNHEIVSFPAGVRSVYLATANNSICDEPYDCAQGTDKEDCDAVGFTAVIDGHSCIHHDDGHCDEPHVEDGQLISGPCAKGTDLLDCQYAAEADTLLADERHYVLHLESEYDDDGKHDMVWLSKVADASIKRCMLESDGGNHGCVPQACIDMTILEKCSGCVNATNHSSLGAAQCAPGLTAYPNNTVLCTEAKRAKQIHKSQWCQKQYHSDGQLPCECVTFYERFYPNLPVFLIAWIPLWIIGTIIVVVIWMIYTPAFVEFGYPGMATLTGRARDHPAWAYCDPLPSQRTRIAMTLLQEKLGRHPSPDALRSGWEHTPFLRHVLTGYKETMVIRKDTVSLVTKNGVPPCPCCRSMLGDAHEYTVLLQDVNFVEIGAELFPVYHSIAMMSLTFSLGLFFSTFITGGLYVHLNHGVCSFIEVSSDPFSGWGVPWTDECLANNISIKPRTNDEVDHLKWGVFVLAIAVYFLFDWLAGKKKKGYILINVSPGGTERGEVNPFAGASPFYIRLQAGAPDSNSVRYKEVVNVIRSAAKHSKKLGKGSKRGALRFRAAATVVKAGIRAGYIVVLAGRVLPWDGPIALAAMQSLQSEETRMMMISDGNAQDLTEQEETKDVQPKAKEKRVSGSVFNEEIKDAKARLAAKKDSAVASVKAKQELRASKKTSSVKEDKAGISKVFVEIDIDGSGAISFDEFSKWLSDWVSRALNEEESGDAGDKSKQLNIKCKAAFDAVNTDGDDELSMSEFATFMADGAVDLFKECGLWGSMISSNLFDVDAIESCFDRFDVDGSGEMDTEELMAAFHDLEKHPTTEEVDMLLHVYDDDHNGVLSKKEFTRLMLEYVQNQAALTEFAERNWCPVNLFGLDFDFVPWGHQHTSMIGDEIISKGDRGFGGWGALSNSNYSSIELSKTRWMHVEGHPAPLWKLNLYLAEALLIFHFIHTHPWMNPFAETLGTNRVVIAEIFATVWYVTRAVTFFLRTRGVATSYSWGKPVQTGNQQSKCEFPVPILQLEEVTQVSRPS